MPGDPAAAERDAPSGGWIAPTVVGLLLAGLIAAIFGTAWIRDAMGSDPVLGDPGGDGTALRIKPQYLLMVAENEGTDLAAVVELAAYTSPIEGGLQTEAVRVDLKTARRSAFLRLEGLTPDEPVWVQSVLLGADGDRVWQSDERRAQPTAGFFLVDRRWFFLLLLAVCGSIVGWIVAARRGRDVWVRRIPALDAVDEAVGRSTEMGQPTLFVPGILDMNDIQTIAGLTLLGHVARRTADYRSHLEVPTSKSLVMTAARETVQTSYLTAGRGELYEDDAISYVTDEQFGYVAYLSGWMVREQPAACFYLGGFFAESLILAETGNAVGAVQMAGTAEPSQLPFFVAACDYTLIGEEFFAASAYLSGDPDQLGSLKGQDASKLIAVALIVVGVALATLLGADHPATVAFSDTVLGG